MENRSPFKSCTTFWCDSSPHAVCSQEGRLSAKQKTQSMSEPSSPFSAIEKDSIYFSTFYQLPEAIDFGSLTPSKREDNVSGGENQRKSSSGPYKLSDRTNSELKEYEQSFDTTRRWKHPTARISPIQ